MSAATHNTTPTAPRINEIAITPTLLSPSKARAAAASTASWAQIDAWLTQVFHPTKVPKFERNDSTQSALLDLLSANESADEERRVVREARVEALKNRPPSPSPSPSSVLRQIDRGEGDDDDAIEEKGQATPRSFLHRLESTLPKSSQSKLTSLATATVLLSASSSSFTTGDSILTIPSQIIHLTRSIFDSEAALHDLQQTKRSLDLEIDRLNQSIAQSTVTSEANPYETSQTEDMQSQTIAMNRETKVVGMKLAEYQERIKVLQGYDLGSVMVEDVIVKEGKVLKQQEQCRMLEAKTIATNGLPPDLDVSRKEVERARNELEEWKKKRDTAFQELVE